MQETLEFCQFITSVLTSNIHKVKKIPSYKPRYDQPKFRGYGIELYGYSYSVEAFNENGVDTFYFTKYEVDAPSWTESKILTNSGGFNLYNEVEHAYKNRHNGKNWVIAVDFDGTVVTHEYPTIGKDIGAVPVLKELVQKGHMLVLNTMRGDKELDEAVNWFKQHEIPLYGINNNPTQKFWTSSPKAFAEIYIDDSALGIPLIKPENERAFVDWVEVRNLLVEKGLL